MRIFTRWKEKCYILCILLIFLIIILFYWSIKFDKINQYYSNAEDPTRCLSDLKSLKNQLNAVTEYKDKIDRLLTQIQKDYNDDRKNHEVIVDSCMSLKREAILCQRQFIELKEECFTVKKNHDNLQKEIDKLKSTKL